jgi:hypothetical protein
VRTARLYESRAVREGIAWDGRGYDAVAYLLELDQVGLYGRGKGCDARCKECDDVGGKRVVQRPEQPKTSMPSHHIPSRRYLYLYLYLVRPALLSLLARRNANLSLRACTVSYRIRPSSIVSDQVRTASWACLLVREYVHDSGV